MNSISNTVLERRLAYGTILKRKNRTLLTDKSTRRVPGAATSTGIVGGAQLLEKIPEGSFKKKGADPQKAGDAT